MTWVPSPPSATTGGPRRWRCFRSRAHFGQAAELRLYRSLRLALHHLSKAHLIAHRHPTLASSPSKVSPPSSPRPVPCAGKAHVPRCPRRAIFLLIAVQRLYRCTSCGLSPAPPTLIFLPLFLRPLSLCDATASASRLTTQPIPPPLVSPTRPDAFVTLGSPDVGTSRLIRSRVPLALVDSLESVDPCPSGHSSITSPRAWRIEGNRSTRTSPASAHLHVPYHTEQLVLFHPFHSRRHAHEVTSARYCVPSPGAPRKKPWRRSRF